MNSAMTTIAFALEGYRMVKSLGVVRGIYDATEIMQGVTEVLLRNRRARRAGCD